MRHLVAVLCAVAAFAALQPALANEQYLGTVIVQDAGTGANAVHNLVPADGGAFLIAPRAKLSIQPSANAYVCVDSKSGTTPTCDATRGPRVDANTLFPTSCSSSSAVTMADGGAFTSCLVSCVPVSGAAVNCGVWQRIGDEY